ncbi:hypothetical protein KUTeg_021901 [Tegillarca granosa]|uniref:Uncharacterized protein n=1 Tax=Tegillarca granosa TaxID=220873 RepID=A0ABQ9E529_TEGGR|nr:hypothetical protein KUTeg_021901 [Tegillarca granosa]
MANDYAVYLRLRDANNPLRKNGYWVFIVDGLQCIPYNPPLCQPNVQDVSQLFALRNILRSLT